MESKRMVHAVHKLVHKIVLQLFYAAHNTIAFTKTRLLTSYDTLTTFFLCKTRDWYVIAEQPAPAPHLSHPEGCAALRIVLLTVPRFCRSCEKFPDEFDSHLLRRKS